MYYCPTVPARTIPEEDRDSLRRLADLSDEEYKKLRKSVDQIEPTLDEVFAEKVAEQTGLDVAVVNALLGMYMAWARQRQHTPLERFVDEVCEGVAEAMGIRGPFDPCPLGASDQHLRYPTGCQGAAQVPASPQPQEDFGVI